METRLRHLRVGLLGILVVLPSAAEPQEPIRGVEVVSAVDALDLGVFRALLIGIDGYEIWPPLRFAERDVSDLEQILVDVYSFEPKNVVSLLGSEATESNILGRLRDALTAAGPRDSVLIYFAGHGQYDPFTETGYWIPANGKLYDDSTWLPFTTVRTMLSSSGVEARSVVVITDSCYGGALSESNRSGPDAVTPANQHYLEAVKTMASLRSRQVIASGGFEEVPDQSQFAALLKSALRRNEYSIVDLEFLFFDQVYLDLRNLRMGQQVPIMARITSGPADNGQFVLVKRESGTVGPIGEPPPHPGGPGDEAPDEVMAQTELAFWSSIEGSDDPELYEDYLHRFPAGVFATLARKKLMELSLANVPEVVGLDLDAARGVLSAAGLSAGTTEYESSARPQGTVISQRPPARAKLGRGEVVDLVIADWALLPDLRGLAEREARAICAKLQLDVVKTSYIHPSKVSEYERAGPGIVVSQRPGPATKLAPGSEIRLAVSGAVVPNLVKMDRDRAESYLRKIGLRVGSVTTTPSATSESIVLEHKPAADEIVAPGTAVDLMLSTSSKQSAKVTKVPARILGIGLPAPSPLAPANGTVFHHFPRFTKFAWEPVKGASTYGIEIELGSGRDWSPLRRDSVKGTSYGVDLVGGTTGRWRVWAVDAKGVEGQKSAWWEFRYGK